MALYRCPHCGVIDWKRTPKLLAALEWVENADVATSRLMADDLGLSIQNASNRLARLRDEGLIVGTERIIEGGGLETVWELIPHPETGARSE